MLNTYGTHDCSNLQIDVRPYRLRYRPPPELPLAPEHADSSENTDQQAQLRSMGCDSAQGVHYFGAMDVGDSKHCSKAGKDSFRE